MLGYATGCRKSAQAHVTKQCCHVGTLGKGTTVHESKQTERSQDYRCSLHEFWIPACRLADWNAWTPLKTDLLMQCMAWCSFPRGSLATKCLGRCCHEMTSAACAAAFGSHEQARSRPPCLSAPVALGYHATLVARNWRVDQADGAPQLDHALQGWVGAGVRKQRWECTTASQCKSPGSWERPTSWANQAKLGAFCISLPPHSVTLVEALIHVCRRPCRAPNA